MKINRSKVSKDGKKSEVSTATSAPINSNREIKEQYAPKKGKNPSGENNISLTSKFRKLNLEDTKKEGAKSSKREFIISIISFTENGEYVITGHNYIWRQKKELDQKKGWFSCKLKSPEKRDEYEDLKSRCNAPNKGDDGNNEFNKGEKGDTLNLDEITISSQGLFKDIDDL